MKTELEDDATDLLFALHDVWPLVHGTRHENKVAELMRRHGDFADMHEWSSEVVYRCRGCGHIYQAKVRCDCGNNMAVCDEGVARFSRFKLAGDAK